MRGLSLIMFLLASGAVDAQMTVKKYFSKDDRPTDAAHAYYYETGKKVVMQVGETSPRIDTVYVDTVKTFYMSTNAIRSTRIYRAGEREGPYQIYHLNGRLKEKGFYKKGQKNGYVIFWTEAGSVKQTLQYFYKESSFASDSFKIINYWINGREVVKDGVGYYDGDLFETGLIERGKVVAGFRDSVWQVNAGDTVTSKEVYDKGKFVRGESIYKGKTYLYDKIIKYPEFPGGMDGMYNFLAHNQRYPREARRSGMQDKVFIKFSVDAHGNLSDFQVIKGRYKLLNDEAIRLVKISPAWIPGEVRGISTRYDFVLPVYYKLEP